ncbi:hypothetical protein D9M71_326970 [compost metagenome]
MACGPSKTQDSPSRGSGGIRLTQQISRSMSLAPLRLVAMLAKAQASAAAITSMNASRLSPSGRPRPISTSPDAASSSPSRPRRLGRSPRNSAAIRMVKNTWLCSTSDDSPAGMPRCMPTKSRPNLITPSSRPICTIRQKGAGIGPRRSSSGSAARAKRRAQNNNGGKSSRPTLITTKFTPQIRVTSRARRMCGRDMACAPEAQAHASSRARDCMDTDGRENCESLYGVRARQWHRLL